MKITLFALFAGLLMLGGFGYGNAEDKTDLSNTAPPKDLIKSAVESAKLEDRNGYKYLPNTDKPYSGWAKGTYDNGQVKELTQFKEGYALLTTYWYENGQKKFEANLKDGKQDGLMIRWYENGQKMAEENLKDGKRDGLWTRWYENGQKKREVNYNSGEFHGFVIKYNSDGTELFRSTYKDDGSELERTKRLANDGDATAQNTLGLMYMSGTGVPQDEGSGQVVQNVSRTRGC